MESKTVFELTDPAERRSEIKNLFKDSASICNSPELITFGLHDVWSEIRKDVAKQLNNLDLSSTVAEELQNLLYKHITVSSNSWQSIHGSLLGLSVITTKTLSKMDSASLRDACFNLVGHPRQPVREEALTLLTNLNVFHSTSFDNILVEKIQSISALNNKEQISITTDGLLVCASLYMQAVEYSEREGMYEFLLSWIADLMSDEASSVRQQAGRALVVMYWKIFNYKDATAINFSTTSGTMVSPRSTTTTTSPRITSTPRTSNLPTVSVVNAGFSVDDTQVAKPIVGSIEPSTGTGGPVLLDQLLVSLFLHATPLQSRWEKLEANLLVIFDILNSIHNNIMQMLLDTTNSVVAVVNPATTAVLSIDERIANYKFSTRLNAFIIGVLKSLGYVLNHFQFEVRRAAVQLLPVVCRVILLSGTGMQEIVDWFNCQIPSMSMVFNNQDRLLQSQQPHQPQQSPQQQQTSETMIHDIIIAAVVSELSIATQLVLECLPPITNLFKTCDTPNAPTTSALTSSNLFWSLTLGGRLQEADAKKDFIACLKQIFAGPDDSPSSTFVQNQVVTMLDVLRRLQFNCLWSYHKDKENELNEYFVSKNGIQAMFLRSTVVMLGSKVLSDSCRSHVYAHDNEENRCNRNNNVDNNCKDYDDDSNNSEFCQCGLSYYDLVDGVMLLSILLNASSLKLVDGVYIRVDDDEANLCHNKNDDDDRAKVTIFAIPSIMDPVIPAISQALACLGMRECGLPESNGETNLENQMARDLGGKGEFFSLASRQLWSCWNRASTQKINRNNTGSSNSSSLDEPSPDIVTWLEESLSSVLPCWLVFCNEYFQELVTKIESDSTNCKKTDEGSVLLWKVVFLSSILRWFSVNGSGPRKGIITKLFENLNLKSVEISFSNNNNDDNNNNNNRSNGSSVSESARIFLLVEQLWRQCLEVSKSSLFNNLSSLQQIIAVCTVIADTGELFQVISKSPQLVSHLASISSSLFSQELAVIAEFIRSKIEFVLDQQQQQQLQQRQQQQEPQDFQLDSEIEIVEGENEFSDWDDDEDDEDDDEMNKSNCSIGFSLPTTTTNSTVFAFVPERNIASENLSELLHRILLL